MIRSELDVLLDKVDDEALRAELRTQIDRLKQKRSFGLVFERHMLRTGGTQYTARCIASRFFDELGPTAPNAINGTTWPLAQT